MRKIIALLILIGVILGCSGKISINKVESLYRSAKAITGATSVGINYQKFGELLQNFATEISIASDKLKGTRAFQELLAKYYDALTIYKDSATLWEAKINQGSVSFIPEGALFVEQYMEPIIKRYNIPKTPQVVRVTGHRWESIPESSVQLLWELAGAKIEQANSMLK